MNVAHDQSDGIFLASVKVALKAEDAEVAPTGREVSGGDLLDGMRTHSLDYSGPRGAELLLHPAGETARLYVGIAYQAA